LRTNALQKVKRKRRTRAIECEGTEESRFPKKGNDREWMLLLREQT